MADSEQSFTIADQPMGHFMRDAERAYLIGKLEQAGGNKQKAAGLAGVPYHTFWKKCKKHGLRVTVQSIAVVVDA